MNIEQFLVMGVEPVKDNSAKIVYTYSRYYSINQ
jgi:hypothetical protein